MTRESDRRTALDLPGQLVSNAPIWRPRREKPSRVGVWLVLAFLGFFWGSVWLVMR